jgi:hypothetical protein
VWLAVGPVTVGVNDEIGGLVALGPVTVEGTVRGDVVSLGGRIRLTPTAKVAGHVTAVCATIEREEGATVSGAVRAEALPEARSIDLGWPGSRAGTLLVGAATIADGDTREAVLAVGGDVTVKRGARITEITVVGGNLKIADGATVSSAYVIGGRLERAGKAGEEDQVVAPVVLDSAAAGGPGAVAGLNSTYTATQYAGPVSINLDASPFRQPSLSISVAGARGGLQVSLNSIVGHRVRKTLAAAGRPPDWEEWLWGYNQFGAYLLEEVVVSDAADPAFADALAVAAALGVSASVSDDQGRSASRSLQIGVPPEAARLAPMAYSQGSYGGGTRGGGGLGGGRGGGDRGGGAGGEAGGGYY